MNFEVYCDESQQELFGSSDERRKGRFVLIGGLWIEAAAREGNSGAAYHDSSRSSLR